MKGGMGLERKDRRSTSKRPSERVREINNVRELRPEDFNTRRSERDYNFRPINSPSSAERQPVQKQTKVTDARTRKKEAVRRRKTVSKPAEPVSRKLILPQPEESDFTIIASVILLSFIGLVMVTSSGYYYAYTHLGDELHFFRRQFIWLGVGTVALLVCRVAPLWLLKKCAKIIYFGAVFCSLIVLFVGQSRNGSTRWLGIGELSFQPAELAKIAVAIYMPVLVEEKQETIHKFRTFILILGVLLVPVVLVAIENLSSGIIIAVMGIIIMFVGGARWKHFFLIVLPIAVGVALFVILPIYFPTSEFPDPIRTIMEKYLYRSERVWAWLDPWKYAQDEGYQAIQSLYAVGSGGFFGRGLGNSIQKLGFIPEAHNDIIFSIICEELGFFGAAVVILLFGVLVWHGIKVSINAPDKFTCLMAVSLAGQVGIQAIMNIAVNTNSMPVTGVSLPFISYGGSSLLFLMASMGLLLNISRYTRKNIG